MKNVKTLITILILFIYAPLASSEEITLDQARRIAEDFFNLSYRARNHAMVDLQMVWSGNVVQTKSSSEVPAFYVFDNALGPGFVVVAGDDVAKPILGYSFESEFVVDNMPSNVKSWFDDIEVAVQQARKSPEVYYSSDPYVGNIVLEIETAKWDQSAPYNNFCPMDGDSRSVTGCVATAIAILMRYHQWPECGVGTIPSYVTSTKGISVPAIELGHSYDWDNMPLVYPTRPTAAQENAVARLMADCGAMVEMDYTSSSSGAQTIGIPDVLSRYMGYDISAGHYQRKYYTDEQWHSMIQNELIENGPVFYRGHGENYGHVFILDGFTDAEYYRLNWGWGGEYNGYFTLDALNPQQNYEYNQSQMAILNVKKNQGGYPEIRGIISKYDGLSSLKADRTVFEPGVTFKLSTGLLVNSGSQQFSGLIGFIIVDAEQNVKEVLYTHKVDLQPNWGTRFSNMSLKFKSDLNFGDCLIAAMYDERNSKWVKFIADQTNGSVDAIPLCSIAGTTSFEYNTSTRIITLNTKNGLEAYVVTEGGTVIDGAVEYAERTITIDTSSMEKGRYRLCLYNKYEETELVFVVGEK